MYVHVPTGEYVEQPYTFTMQDAQAAGLLKSDMYKKWPKVMLRNRVGADAMRSSFPSILLGCTATPDELGIPTKIEGNMVVVDQEALDRGEAVEFSEEGTRGAAEVAAGLAREPLDVEFEDCGPSEASRLGEQEVSPEEAARREIAEAVGSVLEALLPPDPAPEWAGVCPDTLVELAELVKQIAPPMDGDMGRALVAWAETGEGQTETWVRIVTWWEGGDLPGEVFSALCSFREVPDEPNLLRREKPEPEPEEAPAAEEPAPEQEQDGFGQDGE